MMLEDRIYAQALRLAGEQDARKLELLRVLCESATAALAARLRPGVTPADCLQDFVGAAGMMALADFLETGETDEPDRFTAGEMTIQKGEGGTAAFCLRAGAEKRMAPYLRDSFSFRGV